MIYHISLLTELHESDHLLSYKHHAPTELRTVAHSDLELTLILKTIAGITCYTLSG